MINIDWYEKYVIVNIAIVIINMIMQFAIAFLMWPS